MKHHIIRLATAAFALLTGASLAAQGTIIVPEATDRTSRVGTRGANFLEIAVGARATALGSAVVSQLDGPEAMFWNPAGIVTSQDISVVVSYMQLYGASSGITNTGAALTTPLGQGAIGLAFTQFTSGSIDRTTEVAPDGDDPAFPGQFSYTGSALALQYARNITDRLAASAGLRVVQEGIDFAQNTYFGFDLATRFRTGLYGLSVAAAITNIGPSNRFTGSGITRRVSAPRENGFATGGSIPVQFNTRQVQLPTGFRVGIESHLIGDAEALLGANKTHALVGELDFFDAIDTDVQPSLGFEYGYKSNYFLRLGKRWFNEQHAPWKFTDGLSFGGGVKIPVLGRRLTLDYAYTTMGELQNNQVLSFVIGR
ncbi:MAG: PorV/PorQ family protein [Gemmatimonadaceae bacterium]